jgi:hypothetical protein
MDVGTMMASPPLTFRAHREDDEAAILRILNESTDLGCSLDEWVWLFPPEDDDRAIVVGERDGEVQAVCAGTPVGVVVDGRELRAVELRKLASRDRDDAGRILDHFFETFGSSGRFTLTIAPLTREVEASSAFEGAATVGLSALIREKPVRGALRRLLYRAEPARDWEPRLDGLWERVQSSYPVAAVRNADLALRRFAGHPSIRHHRFLVFPRYSATAVAFAVFADDGSNCCWLDLLWDHAHPGALELLAHISGRLVAQWGSSGEQLWLAGDDTAASLLMDHGFQQQALSSPVVAMRSFTSELDARNLVERTYLTTADVGGFGS